MLKCLSSSILLSYGNAIWRYQALCNHQTSTLNGVQHKHRFNCPPSAAPSTPGWFRNKISLIKCSTHILPPSKKDAHVHDEMHVMRRNTLNTQIKATSNEAAPHQRVEKENRKLLPVWRKDDICPLRDIVTLSSLCLWSNNYFSFLKRFSFLCCCTSDVRTCQKWQAWALWTLGSPRWNWHIPKTLPRAWREQSGVAFGVKERPYVAFKCVRMCEREISASLLSKGESEGF